MDERAAERARIKAEREEKRRQAEEEKLVNKSNYRNPKFWCCVLYPYIQLGDLLFLSKLSLFFQFLNIICNHSH